MQQDEEEPRKEPHNDIDDDNDIFGLRSLKNLVMNLSPNLVIRQVHHLIVFTQKNHTLNLVIKISQQFHQIRGAP